jgi:tetratricopeptide (TPR) repeat protein
VSEETEGAISGSNSNGAVDPTAVGLALAGASREQADAFLQEQRDLAMKQGALIGAQLHHLHEQNKQIHLDIWEKVLGVLLRIATAFVGLAVAAGAGWLIWNAANSNDLVIDAFQVPPNLASRGLSGQVVAAKLSDKIAAMQAQTNSQRAPKSYANGLSEGLKLEIPETGVSLSELDRFLREKLGRDLHIGGELVQAGNGIALTARVGNAGSATVTGAEADMDAALQKLAEAVYRISQPYRFAIWLPLERAEEQVAVLKQLAAAGPPAERAWAYLGWGLSVSQSQSVQAGLALYQRGIALDPNNYLLRSVLASTADVWGRTEESLRGFQETLTLVSAHGEEYSPRNRVDIAVHGYRASVLSTQGALLEAAEENRLFTAAGPIVVSSTSTSSQMDILSALHEPGAARAALAAYPQTSPISITAGMWSMTRLRIRTSVALAERDWPAAVATESDVAVLAAQFPGLAENKVTQLDPGIALALAHMGRFAAAEARLKPMPGDCYPCLRARGQVAVLQGQYAGADLWFARAAAIAPSSPYAESEWGQALLERGQPDAAIEKFKLANQKGPRFADPLEGWGEALMAKNQSHLALAKFAQAEKYAPNWGRLHLKWGEALVYAGRKDEAVRQFARATALDLTPSEKSELARRP